MTRHATLRDRGFTPPPCRDRFALAEAIARYLCPEWTGGDVPCRSIHWCSDVVGIVDRQAAADGWHYEFTFRSYTSKGMVGAIEACTIRDDARTAVEGWTGFSVEDIWPNRDRGVTILSARAPAPRLDISPILASAEAFRVAIDCLPVGRDIRGRLQTHIDSHIAAIARAARHG